MLAGVFATKPGEPGPRHPAVADLEPSVDPPRRRQPPTSQADGARRAPGRTRRVGRARVLRPPPRRGRGRRPRGCSASRTGSASTRSTRGRSRRPSSRPAPRVPPSSSPATPTWPRRSPRTGVRPRLLPHGVDLDALPGDRASVHRRPRSCWPSGGSWRRRASTTLLAAVATVDRAVHLRLVGDGPLRGELVGRRTPARARRPGERSAAAHPRLAPGLLRRRRPRRGALGRRRERRPGRAAQRRARGDGQRPAGGRERRRRRSRPASGTASPARWCHPATRTPWPTRSPSSSTGPTCAGRSAPGPGPSRRREFALADCTAAFCATLEAVYG